jgi:hypothetical protein
MALKWSQVKGFDPVALRRWAVWLKVPDAETRTLRSLIMELCVLGYITEDKKPTGYY